MMKKYILLPFLIISLNFCLLAEESTTTTTTNSDLTPAEREVAETYFHNGYSQRAMEEECNKLKDSRACQGNGKTSFLGLGGNTIQMIAKATSIVLGFYTRSEEGKFTKIKENGNHLHLLNAPSPGATACLSIGEYISDKIKIEEDLL